VRKAFDVVAKRRPQLLLLLLEAPIPKRPTTSSTVSPLSLSLSSGVECGLNIANSCENTRKESKRLNLAIVVVVAGHHRHLLNPDNDERRPPKPKQL